MTIFRRAEGFVSRDMGDETVIVPVRAGVANLEAIFTMNGVGSVIWARMEGAATTDELIRAVVDEFEIAAGTAATDVAEFLELLVTRGLAVRTEETP